MADSGREPLILRHPNPTDGRELWQLTADSGVLDLNSAYAYVLWADDFAATSVVALRGRRCVGFITGYRRPQHLSTLMVWQVAVSAAERGSGVATAMLDWLVAAVAHPSERLTVEATVSPSNTASRAFFTGFARRAGVALHDVPGFDAHLFPAAHEPEPRVRIGPLPVRP
ncbi:MAG: diaminobutyrate acetyltransferase [Mycobacteriaceae bacterium]|nr:diaminobutyrate acetyltransferase [Mycobacteriaceae bacterium]